MIRFDPNPDVGPRDSWTLYGGEYYFETLRDLARWRVQKVVQRDRSEAIAKGERPAGQPVTFSFKMTPP